MMAVKDPVIEHYAFLNQEVILKILNKVETIMDNFGEKLKVTRKAFNVITEALQNIAKYGDKLPDAEAYPVFVLDRQSDKYLIASGNLIRQNKVNALKQKIDHINTLDWYGVQQMYKQVIKSNLKDNTREKNSAGLGFIEMARKSEERLIYTFKEYNQEYAYFLFLVTIYKNKPSVSKRPR